MGFLHVGSIRTLSTVIGLDGEGMLLLKLAVQFVLGPDDPLSSGLVQDHCLKGDILPMDPEAANLTWTCQESKVFAQNSNDVRNMPLFQPKVIFNNETITFIQTK